jgi:hypothetical protein
MSEVGKRFRSVRPKVANHKGANTIPNLFVEDKMSY